MFQPPVSPQGTPPPAPPPQQAPQEPSPSSWHNARGALISGVQALERRELWRQGILWGLAAALVLGFAGALVSPWSVDLGRILLVLAPLALVGIACAFGLLLSSRFIGDDLRTARRIGHRAPQVGLDVLAAVELERALKEPGTFSTDLARAFLADVNRRSAQVKPRQVVSTRHTARAAQVLGAVLLAALVCVGLWHKRLTTGWSVAVARPGAHATAAEREPITGDFEVTYRYPPYTGLSSRTVTGSNGELAAPAGTEVLLRTRADRDVQRAEVVVNGKRLPLTVENKRDLHGSLVLDKSGSYAIRFLKGKREVALGPDTAIHVQADAPPQVTIQTPGEEVEVNPKDRLTVKYEASDDYGLTQLVLVYKLPTKAEEIRVPLPHDEGRRSKGVYVWDLSQLPTSPGDRISYYIEAKDNDAIAGAKVGASRTHILKVYSAAEHRQQALKKAQELWDKLVGLLADRLEGPDRGSPQAPEKVQSFAQVDQQALALATQLRETAREIARDRDAPQDLWSALVTVAQSMRPKEIQLSSARSIYLRTHKLGAPLDAVGKRLSSDASGEIAELEKDILYLEALIDRQKLQNLKDLGQELARERRNLTSLVEQYAQSHDPKLKEDILRQVDQLKSRIAELMKQMSQLASGIRDEHLNSEALKQLMQSQDVQSAMDDIEKLLKDGKTDEALKKLSEMATSLEKMLKNFDSADQSMGQEFPELAQKFQKFAEDLKSTQENQKKLADQTQALKDRYREKMKQRLEQKAAELKDQLMKSAQKVAQDYKSLDPNQLNAQADKPLEQAQAELENLQNALKAQDFDLAAESAQRAQQAADDLAQEAQRQVRLDEIFERPNQLRQQSRKNAERLQEDRKQVAEMNRKLQQMFPPPGQMMSEEDKQKLQQLSKEQRSLQKQAQGLQQQMEQMQQMAPVFGDDASRQLEQVQQKMGHASDQMDSKDPGRANGDQKAAMDGLAQLQKSMQQQGQGGKGGIPLPMLPGEQEGFGQQQSQEKVELPDPDQFQAPKEFRKDLLDAMKQGAPDKYKEQVKRYYEELVK